MSDSSHIQLRSQKSDANLTAQQSAKGEVQHITFLSEDLGALYLNDDFSDVILKIDEDKFPSHRIILAARSEYFRAMFFGGMREQCDKEVELLETPVTAFKSLLRYIYTSKLSLSGMKEDLVMDILGLAHKYGFEELQTAIAEYLKAILNNGNLCNIFNISQLYQLRSLTDYCLIYADRNATDILDTQGFLQLSSSAVEQLISRDSFCASEIEIFKAIKEWILLHPQANPRPLLSLVRLSLIRLDDLLNIVRPTNLLDSDAILDAIKEQSEKRTSDLTHRGVLSPDINVATAALGASVICGESPNTLLSGDTLAQFEGERSLTRHQITGGAAQEGIVVELSNTYILNRICLQLWDREPRMYSYYIEVSMDCRDWVRIIDHSNYCCRSKQTLLFNSRAVKYIRVVGTHNSVNRVFHLVAIEAMFTTEPFVIDPITKLIIPSCNIATIDNNALVIEGVSRCRNALLNGQTTNYDWDTGYTCHQLGSGAITIQLPQPYMISSMSLLLWDCDDRFYSYFIEVSTNQNSNWKRVADRTADQCRAWQYLEFDPEPVVFVRIVGTHNSANEVFHCVHFECPARNDDGRAITSNRGSASQTTRGTPTKNDENQSTTTTQDEPSTSHYVTTPRPHQGSHVEAEWESASEYGIPPLLFNRRKVELPPLISERFED